MTAASATQVAAWVKAAGFTGPAAATATAIALAQGADPTSTKGAFGVGGPAGDGAGQAKAAYALYQQQGFTGFATAYTTGVWQLFAPTAQAAINAAPAVSATVTSVPIPNPIDLIGKGVDVITGLPAAGARAVTSAAVNTAQGLVNDVTSSGLFQRGVKIMLGLTLIVVASIQISRKTVLAPIRQATHSTLHKVDRQAQAFADTGPAPAHGQRY